MKKLFLTLISLLFTAFVFAQTLKASNISTESSTVSINNTDEHYSLLASFSEGKSETIKSLVTEALGKPEHATQALFLWNLKSTYTVTLKPGKLIIDLNKDKATGALFKTFERLGYQIQQALGVPKAPSKP